MSGWGKHIPIHRIENYSNQHGLWVKYIPVIKGNNYYVDDNISIDGDAPKKFIGVYDYRMLNSKHKSNRTNWIKYIAKTGHKWYPAESITEHLLNRLGMVFGLDMAESRLAMIGGQLRFLSKYFLDSKKEELVHGADILAGYLNEPTKYIEDIDSLNLTRNLLTIQFIESAISNAFLSYKDDLMRGLVQLIIFDALVGNNDRHFFNWGIVRSLDGSKQPRFSPVYDTARGLFWNYSEVKLKDIVEINKTVTKHINRYCKNSKPKIGWDGERDINHFNLFANICKNEFYFTKNEIADMFHPSLIDEMIEIIDSDFRMLISPNRYRLICECLKYRFEKMRSFL